MAASFSRQRGAIGLMAVVLLGLLLLFVALAVDSGRLYMEKRTLQRVADMAALEAANLGGECAAAGVTWNNATAQGRALQSALRNGFAPGANATLEATIGGVVIGSDAKRDLNASATLVDGVKVKVRKKVAASLIFGGLFGATVELPAEAIARRTAVASFTVGSGLLRLDGSASPLLAPVLKGVLDGNVNLGVLTPQGIATANVSLLDFLDLLQAQAGIGTLDELLDTRIGVLPYVQVVGSLMKTSGLSSVDLSGAKLLNLPGVTTTLGQVLGLAAGTGREALKTTVNLFDLLTVGAIAANGTRSVELALSVANLASATLEITEAPKFASGPAGIDPATGTWRTQASTGQMSLVLKVNPSLSKLLPIGTNVIDADVDIAVRVGLAEATAGLKSIQCTNPGRVEIEAQTSTDSIALTSSSSKSNPGSIRLSVGALTILNADLKLGGNSAVIGSASGTLAYTVTTTANSNGTLSKTITPNPQTLYSPVSVSLPSVVVDNVQILYSQCVPTVLNLGCLLNGVIQYATNAVVQAVLALAGGPDALLNMAVSQLSSAILNPLLTALGIKVGFADVTLEDVHLSSPQLVR
ncbi:pilus assembly protein TadG-related protein [Pseudomonas sp. LRF_L74]|uniref:pilus assembly protein TadG-related protein n=1 Tax=Pseudomonas sp. LRF_L74 TaxID=3369422 RepID=UPI003F63EF58